MSNVVPASIDRVLEHWLDGVLIIDRDHRVCYVNPMFLQLTSMSQEMFLSQPLETWLQNLNIDIAASTRVRQAVGAGQGFRGDVQLCRQGTSAVWVNLTITPTDDEQGQATGHTLTIRDVQAERDIAAAHEKSLGQLELVMAQSNDGLWEWDLVNDSFLPSARWYEMLGYEVQTDSISIAALEPLIHPDDRARVSAEMLVALNGSGNDLHVEFRAQHHKGHFLSVARRGLIQRDPSGRARRIYGITTNLTLQKEREAKLSLAAAVFLQSREGVLMTDAEHRIIMVNKAFTDITGYEEAEVLGKNPSCLSSGRQAPAFYQAMWAAIDTQGRWEGEIWNRRKDDSIYPEWLTISAVRNKQLQTTHYIGNFSDLSNHKAAESRIQWLSHFDTLTGLPNRTLLKDRTEQMMATMQRDHKPLAMVLVGIDHFKALNDALGHQLGDELLVAVARRMSDNIREHDVLARLGGKEFVVLLPDTLVEKATEVAAALLRSLSQGFHIGHRDVALTASIGVAASPLHGKDFDTLFKSVELAMHHAQLNGRNNCQLYNDQIYQQVLAHDKLVNELREALASDQFQLAYQPLVDLKTGQISGLEALLRWTHPELGEVPPSSFIPIAETSGLIKTIGAWVLRRACQDMSSWQRKGLQIPHVAVNVSPLQFEDGDLIAQVKSAVLGFQLDPGLLCLELTETALMGDDQRSEDMLRELRQLGIRLSLDDFGTGYSSLSYLKRFPFDKVKIDQSFVRDITVSQSDHVIVNVIVSMAHGLGLKVIAEGVETEAQCEIMRTSGCDEIQGYFFSKPIAAANIEALFTEGRQLPPHLLRLQKPQRTLLLVDDEPNIVAALKRVFRRDGHQILTANSGAEGLEILSKHKVDVIISDQRMPVMTGVEFLRAAKAAYPDTIRIVLSGYTELQSVTDAINEGAVYRFLTKPWEDDQLRAQIQKAFDHLELQEENRQLDMKIRSVNQELVAANRHLAEVLKETRHQVAREQTSLEIVREALQYMPVPVIGVDDEGLMAFINAAAQQLFEREGPLLGAELVHALPAVEAAIAKASAGVACDLTIDQNHYAVTWNTMGASSPSRGKLVTISRKGSPP